ncbi:methanol oxidation system protein MoxJ [Methylobacterium pseudosasicola]|uniref:Amino acid ABC transporter substrate-binding protein, PAAT family n=1 Tax=Methylobacterium pseudosasicola TaxID=582667 RepID=A0A1I4NQR6_9HYPH|nr:methanol oxidation system protein MoxJ [Methylobacterium pseudosasicola]SFM17647.1 amino acid ABC transporter substrate-binding protein, PAAT family [Methylobacterium pseudosasicola]
MPLLGGLLRAATCAAALLALANPVPKAWAQESEAQAIQAEPGKAAVAPKADPSTLRICASEKQPPLSMRDGSGLENRVAAAVAEAMGKKPVFVWLAKPAIYLVRDGLEKRTCDVVVGLDSDDPRVLTTKPYYRSGYVFITRADKDLDVTSWSDPRLKTVDHMVVPLGSPGEAMLKDIGRYEEDMAYLYSLVGFRAPRNQYTQIDPARIVSEVANDKAEVGVAFGPDVARYVKDSPVPLRMTLVPNDTVSSDGRKMPQSFDQSMGVRRDDTALRDALDAAIAKAKPQIDAILKQDGVPVAIN